MSLPTPLYDLKNFPDVYEPSEDTFLFLDALECDADFINSVKPANIAEVGCGSGVVITFLASILKSKCTYFATDINPSACLATLKTATLNNVTVECLNMNMLSHFKHSLFDVLLFNPPYVVTEDSEIGPGLQAAWAGGADGREIIDKFLANLNNLISDTGVCYMVVIKENKPDEIKKIMYNLGFNTCVIKERKILAEHLFILRFSRVQR